MERTGAGVPGGTRWACAHRVRKERRRPAAHSGARPLDQRGDKVEQSRLILTCNCILGIADDVLGDLYVSGKYRDVILPMIVLRRLDAMLEGSKQDILDMKASLDKAGVVEQDPALRQVDALGTLIDKLTSPDVNISPDPVLNSDGSVKHAGLDDHAIPSHLKQDGSDASFFSSKQVATA